MKNTKIFGAIILTLVILFSAIGLVQADTNPNQPQDQTYTYSLREGNTVTESIAYTNNDAQAWNVTFTITSFAYPVNGADSVTFAFNPVMINNVLPSTNVNTDMTITTENNAIVWTYTADITVEKIPVTGGAVISEVIHDVIVRVIENTPATMSGMEDFNMIIGETKTVRIDATDLEGDDLTFTLSGQPAGMSMTVIDDDSIDISWAPTVFVENTNVEISVDDGYDVTTETFSAGATNTGLNLNIDEIEFGSDSQDREELVTATFSIMNTGDETITGLSVEQANVNSDYEFTIVSQPDASIASGDSTTFTARVYFPIDQDSGRKTIGDLLINYDTNQQMSEDIFLITESFLEVDRLKLYLNGDSEGSIDEGDNIDVEIDDEVELRIKLENTDNTYNFEDGIELTLEIDDLDIEEDADYDDDLDEGDTSDEIDMEFEIPSDEDDGIVEAILTITAEDENGAEHVIEYNFEFDVDKPSHMIKIQDVTLATSTVRSGRLAEIQVEIENTGKKDEDEVYIEVLNSNLNIEEKIGPFDLDEGDDITRSLSFEIPENTESGEYTLYIRTYYDRNDFSDSELISINIIQDSSSGSSSSGNSGTTGNQGTTVTTNPDPTSPLNNPEYGEPIESNFFGSDSSVLVLLIILIVVMIGVITVILIPGKGK